MKNREFKETKPADDPVEELLVQEPTEDETPSKPETVQNGSSYEVVKGDTLITIARRFGTNAGLLQEVNHIEDHRALQIGTVLVIPE